MKQRINSISAWAMMAVLVLGGMLTMGDAAFAQSRKKQRTRKPARSTARVHQRVTPTVFTMPSGIDLKLRLTSPLSSKHNQTGDRFTATVLEPNQYEGAVVEGHIATLKRSGKLTGKTEMRLAFDSITLPNGRMAPMRGEVQRVYDMDSVDEIDEEGQIESDSRSKDTTVRTAGGAAVGAIIGGLAGGGKGAAIGAIVGAGVGAGSVYVQGKKDLKLEVGTEMLVRTTAAPRGRTL